MAEENPRPGAGAIPPPPSRPPTSALPVIEVDAERGAKPSTAPSRGPAEPSGQVGAPGAPPAGKPAAKAPGTAFAGAITALSDRARPLARRIRPVAGRIRPVARRIRRQGSKRLGVAAAVLAVLGLLAWWAVASVAGTGQPSADNSPAAAAASASSPASRGTLPLEGVTPMDFQLRDCFKDFDPNAQQSTVVDCATGHSAQLVAVEKYAAGDSYPGREALKQKARDVCRAAPLTDKTGDALSYKLAYPSSSSWNKGDRRVDCYVVANTGNVLTKSLLP
ncbi:septum formation family protein [Arthrobacter sp. NPDC058192]|uniref:septum formation family protein n=1 Tax=Arthrobacter sp. NPDC058192 TaxID=3346372 RepID=UPI0036E6D8B3